MTINERMTALGIPGRPYSIAAQLDWAEAELDRLEAQLNFSNATITELRGQLEKMAAERDSLKQQLAAANANVSDLRGKLDYMTAYRDGLHQRLVTEQQQLAAEREANRWIPVSERLPTVSGNYLTNASHWITAHELVFTVKTKQWWDSTNQEYVEPTHWRELPKFYQEISS